MPLHSGPTLPTNEPGNPYVINTHPEYWIRDSANTPQPLNDSYVIANPTMPQVKQHIREVVGDVTSKYAVDGIHLDYIRFYHDTTSTSTPLQYPTDPASVGAPGDPRQRGQDAHVPPRRVQAVDGRQRHGPRGADPPGDEVQPPRAEPAAIWRDANIGFNAYQQDWKTSVDRGLLGGHAHDFPQGLRLRRRQHGRRQRQPLPRQRHQHHELAAPRASCRASGPTCRTTRPPRTTT